ncbi:DUF1566 domain-containing protein [Leptospira sp. 201903070]|uniref:DUF1566 domain-containing protein n=1 Tax=Leptospira ainlahdjerensis TaxID=2810033 RepID=A0ABS2UFZ4_9LEPT|nr:DUF1566 domain-containing protein [Leptospira ainlahdjerensis]MBM9579295.1 DUF1566 domain-containing protein [Leptospira ainlahdjerensis]
MNFFYLPSSSISFPGGDSSTGTSAPALTPVAPTGSITYSSATTLYVSGTGVAGTISYYDISWSSDMNGQYDLRIGATNCSDGTVNTSSTVTASTSITNRIQASDLAAGTNAVKLCLKSADGSANWDMKSISAVRDDSAPTIAFSPAAGTYGASIPNITLTCSDTGSAGCLAMTYRNDGSNPTINSDGTAPAGSTVYSAAFAVPNNATTDVKVIAIDKAGNKSAVSTSQYVVAVGNPTITVNSVSKVDLRSVDSSVIKWESDIAGNYEFRLGGTNCAAGTNGTALSPAITGSAAAATEITSTIPGSSLAVGANTVRICLTTSGSNVGSNSRTLTVDNTAPTVSSASPANNTTNLSVDQNTFSLVFSEAMDKSVTPLPEHHDSGVSGNPQIAWPTMTGAWSTDGLTYTVSLNSKLPEWHRFYLQFNDSNFKDKAGNTVTGAFVSANKIKLDYRSFVETNSTLISRTLQATCYDSSGNASACATSGQDAEFNAATPYGLGTPTTLGAYTNDRVTPDTLNGKYWKTCAPTYVWSGATCVQDTVDAYHATLIGLNTGSGILDLTWNDSLAYCLQLNLNNAGAGFAGKKTWRLPTLSEQMSILIYEGSLGNEAVPSSSFPGMPNDKYQRYWTSTNTITAIAANGITLAPSDLTLSTGGNSWGAWQISIFGGGTHMNNKGKAYSWGNWYLNKYPALAMCIAD